jgi:1-deoxy-D-xylulose-5-phosphate reductoisomerase
VKQLDFTQVRALEFEAVDEVKFPAMTLWRSCLGSDAATTRGATLNAANEEAVGRFLNQGEQAMSFGQVTDLVCGAVEALPARPCRDLAAVLEADAQAREWVRSRISGAGAAP